jgi:hypothetical protein
MKELYIDFDGVILDTIPPLNEFVKKQGISMDDQSGIRKCISTFDFKQLLKDDIIIKDGINAIKDLSKCGKYIVSILTHINSLEEGVVKTNYIRRHLKDTTLILVPTTVSKTQMVHTEGAILVDDFPGNLIEWEANGGIGIKFTDNLDKDDFIRINDLRMLLNMFEGE